MGGHCIGVDPYYLTHKAEMLGYHPQVILAGRRINDGMGKFIAENTVKRMIQSGCSIKGARVNILGLTFKENCPDLRNSKVPDIIAELQSYGIEVTIHDPVADPIQARHEFALELSKWDALPLADAVVIAVAHDVYRDKGLRGIRKKVRDNGTLIDVKAQFSAKDPVLEGLTVWRL